jgi:hypothetical protein
MLNGLNFFPKNKHQKSKYYINMEKLRGMPVKKVMLFTNARDEKHIKEWAAHHLLIGFDHVYIFDHKSTFPLSSEFAGFDKRVIIERCELNVPPKFPLMRRAAEVAAIMRADWFIYLDADEFIILNNFTGVKALLNRYYFADSLALNWLMFGTNNHVTEPDGLILENYTRSDSEFNQHVKTFVRPSQISLSGPATPHSYYIVKPARMFAITGESMANKVFNPTRRSPFRSHAFIAHYVYQSEETYKRRKINLPSDDTGTLRAIDTDVHAKHNDRDNFIPRKYAERVRLFILNKGHKNEGAQ